MGKYDPFKHHRRSIRRKGWDYRSPGYYFVTICTCQWQHLFEDDTYHEIAANALCNVPKQPHAQHVELDEWVVMPNHVHAIFVFKAMAEGVEIPATAEGFQNAQIGSLGVVVGRYKTAVTRPINNLQQSLGSTIWHRGYYDRIIRNEREWRATQRYIIDNPLRWAEDRENLDALLAKMTYHR
ncbi:MAG: transposase [Chloroflexota bacterium]